MTVRKNSASRSDSFSRACPGAALAGVTVEQVTTPRHSREREPPAGPSPGAVFSCCVSARQAARTPL